MSKHAPKPATASNLENPSTLFPLNPMPPDTRIGPAVDGSIFYRDKLIMNTCLVDPRSFNSEKYVLSIIWLPLKPGYNVLDYQSAAARLWHASLDYIRCIRGCVELCWGRDIEATEPALVLLIHWAGVWAWKNFQQSPGVSLIRGILRGNPLNRTVNLHPSYLYGSEKIVEVVFLSVGLGVETNLERNRLLQSLWQPGSHRCHPIAAIKIRTSHQILNQVVPCGPGSSL